MNISQARREIKVAKTLDSTKLDLSAVREFEKLNDNDLNELISEIGELESLTSLDLKWNRITDATCLGQLKKLTFLDLSGNNIENYDFLTGLDNLIHLELSWDKISDYKFLNKLNCFTSLDLSRKKLKNYNFLKEIKGLVSLKLNNNTLSDVSFLKDLKEITELDLSNNNLSDVSFLKELKNLTWLDLSKNKISNISFLKELNHLKVLHIDSLYLELPRNLKQIFNYNSSINASEISHITRYYKQLEKQGKDYIYEAKVLVVGEPKAGKTTLAEKVKDNENWHKEIKRKESKSTVGIVINTLPLDYHKDNTKKITTHFWDFGGQDIQYFLHQYFFTESSLYILLADGRKELTNFNYWFEIIATLGKGSPVLVVLNENECKPIKTFNVNEFRKEFNEALESIEERNVDFYLDEDGRFESLRNEIQTKVCNLKHIGQPLPKKWVDIRNEIEHLKEEKAYIDKDEYAALCKKQKLTNRDDQQQVLDYLHVLGIALNYKSDINLRNKLILKPNWVIDALYVVLKDNKIEKDKGMFEVDYVYDLWEKEGYSSKDCEILLNLMQKGSFEIAYKLANTSKFIVPILLPYKPIDYQLEEINSIQVKIQYKFMPKGIVSRLIVRLHKDILTEEREQIVWNKGVLLSRYDSKSEIVEREQSKQILIKVVGKNQHHNKELLTIIRNEIVEIHKDWFDNRLNYEEFVPCICNVCKETDDKQLYKLSVLENALDRGKKEIECQTSFSSVNVRKLLEGIYIEDNGEEKHSMGSGNTYNIAGNAQIVNDTKDNVSINQNNYLNNQNINQKLDDMFRKIDEKQSQELQTLVNQLVNVIEEKLVKENKLSVEEVKAFEEIKMTSDSKARIKYALPLNWFISQATGFTFEIEKEWKISKEIKAESVISSLRKYLNYYQLQETKFNEIDTSHNENNSLKD